MFYLIILPPVIGLIFFPFRLIYPGGPDDILYMGLCDILTVQQELHDDAVLFCFLHSTRNNLLLLSLHVSGYTKDEQVQQLVQQVFCACVGGDT